MKKSDLKSGMVIEFIDGEKGILIKDYETKDYGIRDIILGRNSFVIAYSGGFDINNVAKIYWDDKNNNIDTKTLAMTDIPLYWQRPKAVELTISEIEAKLGLTKGTLKIVNNEKK